MDLREVFKDPWDYTGRWKMVSIKARKAFTSPSLARPFFAARLSTARPSRPSADGDAEPWKLDNHSRTPGYALCRILSNSKAGHVCTGHSNRHRLVDLASRVARGLILYDHRPVDELRLFCDSRRIQYAEADITDKKTLIDRLEIADEEATFTRFLSLPPELREHIYQLHFESLEPSPLPLCTPPPLCETSRLLRQESLLSFYRTRRFEVRVNVAPLWSSIPKREPPLPTLMRRFLRLAPLKFIQSLRKLRIIVTELELSCDIDFPTRDLPAVVEVRDWPGNMERKFPKFERLICDRLQDKQDGPFMGRERGDQHKDEMFLLRLVHLTEEEERETMY